MTGSPTPTPEPSSGTSSVSAAPTFIKPAAVVPGSLVDVTLNVVGPATGVAGEAFIYTVTIGNNSLPDADGATFAVALPGGSTGVSASCAASGGASCPAALTTTNAQVKGTAGLLPHNGQLTVTITGRFAAPSPSSVTCSGSVNAPAGTTDYDLSSNKSSVATAVTSVTGVVVSQTQTTTSMSPGSPNTYTLTWKNNGPANAAGTVTSAMMYFNTGIYGSANITGFTCDASGGLVCPTTSAVSVGGSFGVVFSQTQPTFPAGATMTITYAADIVPASPQACGSAGTSIGNDIRATLPVGFANVGTTDLFIYSSAPGTPACPTTDLTVRKDQDRSTITAGGPVTYTVTYRNLGPSAADGAGLTDSLIFATPIQSLAVQVISCTTTGGAECPTLTDKTITSSGQPAVQAAAPVFPAGSSIQIVYSAAPKLAASPACSAGGTSSVENRASIAAPAGVIEVGPNPNQASVFATAPPSPVCPRATLGATKTIDKPSLFPGDPTVYTVTYTNRGPDAADGAAISDYLQLYNARFITSASVTILSCIGSGGATCPSFIANKTVSGDSYLWAGSVGAFPAGATLTVVVKVDPVAGGSGCTSSSATVPNTALVTLPGGMFGSNGNSGAINAVAACADIAVNASLDRSSVQPGDPVTYSVKVSNASPGTARSVQFSMPLPRGFVFDSAGCAPSSSASTCVIPDYDPASRTLTASIPAVGPNQGFVTFTISGVAGPVGGTYSATATAGSLAVGPDRFIDPVLASNASTAVLTIFGTASKVTVTKQISGLPAGGVPVPLRFSGSITCDFEGSKPWTATVPAGASTALSAPVPFFDGQQCTVAEGAAPALPPGFSWVGPGIVEPSDLAVDGPSADYEVTVTNRLTPNAALMLAKTVSRNQATVGQVVTFTYQVTNGGPIPVSAPTIHETSFSGSNPLPAASCPPGELPAGESVECSVDYTVTEADVATGLLTNVAYATATPSAGPQPQTAAATASVRLVEPPALTLSKTAEPMTVTAVGEEITYTYALTNTGGVPLTAPTLTESAFDGSGDPPLPTCPGSAATLGVGAQASCTAVYRVTQADLDRGAIDNSAVASANAPDGFVDPVTPTVTARVTVDQQPGVRVAKSVFPNSPVAFVPGTTLTYSFVVTNTGNVTLSGIRVDDGPYGGTGLGGPRFGGTGELGEILCELSTLAPGEQTTCSTEYRITEADAGAGSLTNTATATGTPPTGPPVTSAADTAVVPDAAAPSVALEKAATPNVVHLAGEVIQYAYRVTNTGNVPLVDLVVTETGFTGAGAAPVPTCPGGAVLPGETITCGADYTVTAADLRQTMLVNTAAATAAPPSGSAVTSATSTASVDVVPGIPGLKLTKSASPADITDAGQEIAYSFEVVNSGETPLKNVTVAETDFSGSSPAPALSCPDDNELAVGDSFTCTASYTVTQADVDAGNLVNTAQATAVVPGVDETRTVVATDSVDVLVDSRPRLGLTKSASPAGPDAFVAGQQIEYTFVVRNSGNVTLKSATIAEGTFSGDSGLGPVDCDDREALAPGEQLVCKATYALTQADIDHGLVTNTAQAVANPPIGDPTHSADASAEVRTASRPALTLDKSATPTTVDRAGDAVEYAFVVQNTGNVSVREVTIEETRFTGAGSLPAPTCPSAVLPPGQSTTCTAKYAVVPADISAGEIDNTAVATATLADAAGTAVASLDRNTPRFEFQGAVDGTLAATARSAPSSARVVVSSAQFPGDPGAPAGNLARTGVSVGLLAALAAAILAGGVIVVRASGIGRSGRPRR